MPRPSSLQEWARDTIEWAELARKNDIWQSGATHLVKFVQAAKMSTGLILMYNQLRSTENSIERKWQPHHFRTCVEIFFFGLTSKADIPSE